MGRVWFWFKSPARRRYSNLRSCPWIPSQKNAKYFLRRQKIFSGLPLAEWEGLRTGPRGWGDGAWAGGWAGRGAWKFNSMQMKAHFNFLLRLCQNPIVVTRKRTTWSTKDRWSAFASSCALPAISRNSSSDCPFDTKVRRTVLLPWHTLFYSRALQRCRWLTKCYL